MNVHHSCTGSLVVTKTTNTPFAHTTGVYTGGVGASAVRMYITGSLVVTKTTNTPFAYTTGVYTGGVGASA